MVLMQSPPGAETVIDGRQYFYFCGTSYLGLHGHPAVINAACEATRKYGIASATTRAGFGNTPPTLEVERLAAEFFDAEDAFYFPSGYLGSQLLLSSQDDAVDALFLDEYAHYSVADACRSSGLPVFTFSHADPDALRDTLRRNLRPREKPLVMSDGVFAARGTIAPVIEYLDLLRGFSGSQLCLDDCHSLGVLGRRGRGTYEHFGVFDYGVNTGGSHPDEYSTLPRLHCVGTLSKAFGGYGGIICGSKQFISHIRGASHYFEGASTPPIPAAAASAMGLEIVTTTPQMITRLQENARRLKGNLRQIGLNTNDSPVPIISLEIGDAVNMRRIQQALADEGILIAHMGCYSGLGPDGALRIAVFSTHTDAMIDRLTETLGKII